MKPTIGRVVIYNTTEEQRELMLQANSAPKLIREAGVAPKQLPAIVTSVCNESQVNLQVILDGQAGTFWLTTVDQGDNERQWNWPVIEK
ncbi:MAG: hypothetical protein WC389_15935 [Lutibacter sp.]|jgi:hypothetical protein